MAELARICTTPVKGTALHQPAAVDLQARGAVGDRLFHWIDDRGLVVNGKKCGALVQVAATYDGGVLRMRLPDGSEVAELVTRSAEPVTTNFFGRPVGGTLVDGPFAAAVSAFTGQELRLVQVDADAYAADMEPVTLVATATLDALRAASGAPAEHWRDRFRFLFELDGLDAFEEEGWSGRRLRLGTAELTVGGPVPRCAVTSQDPRTGAKDFDTLGAIRDLRGGAAGLLVGMYARVTQPGRVPVGATLELAEPAAVCQAIPPATADTARRPRSASPQTGGRHAGSRPVSPSSRSNGAASSGTATGGPNSPALPWGLAPTTAVTQP
ncbi:MAG: hypothetical protein JWM67_501, partial [Mycobacterium sp.]|nr:hypothetical protein [Mycobacterium sp.]